MHVAIRACSLNYDTLSMPVPGSPISGNGSKRAYFDLENMVYALVMKHAATNRKCVPDIPYFQISHIHPAEMYPAAL
jgi:hypothetical protein